jgi:U2 small nuclear ribonucleoprotein A'
VKRTDTTLERAQLIYSFSNHVGHKIPTIENLGVAGPQDAIDFTDNDITSITNFPLSPRLSTLLLARNRITNIQPNLFQSIPNLNTLVLSINNVAELADLDPLRRFPKLVHLSLIENPVVRKEVSRMFNLFLAAPLTCLQHYRAFLIWRIPSLRFLDFQKIKPVERTSAAELFGTEAEPTELASKILGIKSRTFDAGAATIIRTAEKKTMRVKLTDSEKKRVQTLVASAKTMQEISRIERELAEGKIPAGCADGDRMET